MQDDEATIMCRSTADTRLVRSEGTIDDETKRTWIELAAAWELLAESVEKAETFALSPPAESRLVRVASR